jgi:hypothetical protein
MPQDAAAGGAAGPLRPTPVPPPPLPSLADLPPAGAAPGTSGGGARLATAVNTPAPPIVGPRLVGVSGAVAGQVIPLGDASGPLSIGREPGNRVPLTQDATVSRRHARIEAQNDGFAVVDQNSHNGTFVNGVRTAGQVLQPGDEIQIGAAIFRFEG